MRVPPSFFLLLVTFIGLPAWSGEGSYRIAPTGQVSCYDTHNREIACASRGQPLYGQDAQFATSRLQYKDNGDGTVTDLVTGLIWQKTPGAKVTWEEAMANARRLRLSGRDDWRLPNIKELYSLMDFSGMTPVANRGTNVQGGKPYLDTSVFDFRYGDTSSGERVIDCQYWSATEYAGRTMGRDETVFGVNFADGRIKGYPKVSPGRGVHRMYVRYVRGNPIYGQNDFMDNRNGTVTDRATGLMWMQADSGQFKAGSFRDGRLNWSEALVWSVNLDFAGYRDWRLPNAKELQSIVDYSRSPQRNRSPAINPIFRVMLVRDEGNRDNYPFFWTSTTHLDGPSGGDGAVYVAFGEALGYMHFPWSSDPMLVDVHGAGAQRSDPKVGDANRYPEGRGPQGDVIRVYNFVRLVRDVK